MVYTHVVGGVVSIGLGLLTEIGNGKFQGKTLTGNQKNRSLMVFFSSSFSYFLQVHLLVQFKKFLICHFHPKLGITVNKKLFLNETLLILLYFRPNFPPTPPNLQIGRFENLSKLFFQNAIYWTLLRLLTENVAEEILLKEGNNKEKKISECVDMLFN